MNDHKFKFIVNTVPETVSGKSFKAVGLVFDGTMIGVSVGPEETDNGVLTELILNKLIQDIKQAEVVDERP